MAQEQINLYDGLFSAGYESLYDFRNQSVDKRKNLGHDFRNSVLTKAVSNALLRNQYLSDFIILLQDVVVMYIDSATHLKIYKNFTVSKNYKKIR
jgi:hypothetical protein